PRAHSFAKESSTKPLCITKKRWNCFRRTPMLTQTWAARFSRKAGLLTQLRTTGRRFASRRKMLPLKVTWHGSWRPRRTRRLGTGRKRFCLPNRLVALRVGRGHLFCGFWPLLMRKLVAFQKLETLLMRHYG